MPKTGYDCFLLKVTEERRELTNMLRIKIHLPNNVCMYLFVYIDHTLQYTHIYICEYLISSMCKQDNWIGAEHFVKLTAVRTIVRCIVV